MMLNARVRDVLVDLGFERKFNPLQPRDTDGKWSKDLLGLAGKISLGDGESLQGSGKFTPTQGEGSIAWAVIDGPSGREIRLGALPTDDVGKWRAGNKGATASLSPRAAAHLRDDLDEAATKGKAAAKKANAIYDSGEVPTDPVHLGEAAVAEGRIASPWGDVRYSTYLDGDDPISYQTTIEIGDASPEDVSLDAKDLAKLVKELDGMTDAPESMAARSLLDAFDSRQFSEELHPRVPAGSANGGQFGSKSEQKQQPAQKTSNSQGKATPAKKRPRGPKVVIPKGSMGYDPSTNHGTGYGSPNGDKRVHTLQEALNRLGFTDMHGRKLTNDGKLGPLTTSALKAAQRALGLKADGIASPKLLRRLATMKRRPRQKKPTAAKMPAKKARPPRRKFDPSQPRDLDGKWGNGGVSGAVKGLLADLVRVHPGGRVDSRNGSSIDWTGRKPNGDYEFEATGDDGDTVMFDMSPAEVKELHSHLTEALSGGDDPGYYAPESGDDDNRGFDWSVRDEDDEGEPLWSLDISGYDEFGNGESAGTVMEMTEDDMREWHTALTLSLIHAQLDQSAARPDAPADHAKTEQEMGPT